jgi:hypothetical protein
MDVSVPRTLKHVRVASVPIEADCLLWRRQTRASEDGYWPIAPVRRCTGANPYGQTVVDPLETFVIVSYRLLNMWVPLQYSPDRNRS